MPLSRLAKKNNLFSNVSDGSSDVAIHAFDAEFCFHPINEIQTADRDRL
jgi:hypothetical protein